MWTFLMNTVIRKVMVVERIQHINDQIASWMHSGFSYRTCTLRSNMSSSLFSPDKVFTLNNCSRIVFYCLILSISQKENKADLDFHSFSLPLSTKQITYELILKELTCPKCLHALFWSHMSHDVPMLRKLSTWCSLCFSPAETHLCELKIGHTHTPLLYLGCYVKFQGTG